MVLQHGFVRPAALTICLLASCATTASADPCGRAPFFASLEQKLERQRRCQGQASQADTAGLQAQMEQEEQQRHDDEDRKEQAQEQRLADAKRQHAEQQLAALTAKKTAALDRASAAAAGCDDPGGLVKAYELLLANAPGDDPRVDGVVADLEKCRLGLLLKTRALITKQVGPEGRRAYAVALEDKYDAANWNIYDGEFVAAVSGTNADVLVIRSKRPIGPRARTEDEQFEVVSHNAEVRGFRVVTMKTPRKKHSAKFDTRGWVEKQLEQMGLTEPFLTPSELLKTDVVGDVLGDAAAAR